MLTREIKIPERYGLISVTTNSERRQTACGTYVPENSAR